MFAIFHFREDGFSIQNTRINSLRDFCFGEVGKRQNTGGRHKINNDMIFSLLGCVSLPSAFRSFFTHNPFSSLQ